MDPREIYTFYGFWKYRDIIIGCFGIWVYYTYLTWLSLNSIFLNMKNKKEKHDFSASIIVNISVWEEFLILTKTSFYCFLWQIHNSKNLLTLKVFDQYSWTTLEKLNITTSIPKHPKLLLTLGYEVKIGTMITNYQKLDKNNFSNKNKKVTNALKNESISFLFFLFIVAYNLITVSPFTAVVTESNI